MIHVEFAASGADYQTWFTIHARVCLGLDGYIRGFLGGLFPISPAPGQSA